ncbi:MAG: HAMP domain-containing histidine kinase [Desulfobacterales bacterium]|nr:MAG: HAMP domain-containing histidine kinase [Desulfobacterales bacterium]
MTITWDTVGTAGLQFFGQMSASNSHEIKNVLAIINENAGLLEDLMLMVDKGVALDPQRLKSLARKLAEQTRRADQIVKKMNQFAHSVDYPVKSVDLNEILDLMMALTGRLATMRNVNLELKASAAPVTLTTSPFFLMNLVWLCLDFAMNATAPGRPVLLAPEKTAQGANLRFSGLERLAQQLGSEFPAEREKRLLRGLKAQLSADAAAQEILLCLPAMIDG